MPRSYGPPAERPKASPARISRWSRASERSATGRKRQAWTVGATGIEQSNPAGVPGVGSVAHCFHGKHAMVDEFLDWKPGRHLTRRMRGTPMGECVITWEIEAELTDPPRTTLTVLATAATRRGRMRVRAMALPFRRYLARSTDRLAGELATAGVLSPSRRLPVRPAREEEEVAAVSLEPPVSSLVAARGVRSDNDL